MREQRHLSNSLSHANTRKGNARLLSTRQTPDRLHREQVGDVKRGQLRAIRLLGAVGELALEELQAVHAHVQLVHVVLREVAQTEVAMCMAESTSRL